MPTVDQLLIEIANNDFESVKSKLPSRDYKVLSSLIKIVTSNIFLTQRQGELLIKILKNQSESFPCGKEYIEKILEAPVWSKSFRPVEQYKKFYINTEQELVFEFTYYPEFSDQLIKVHKKITKFYTKNPKFHTAELTEKNIVVMYELANVYDFEIQENIKNYYETIKSWSEAEVRDQFLITNFAHSNFQKHIISDLGLETTIDQNVIVDRSIRYNYRAEKSEKNPENLTEIIANRSDVCLWLDKKTWSLDEILKSLINLRRLPVMLIFDNYDEKQNLENLENLSKILEKNGIFDGVGIYFRLNNNTIGKEFNKIIADKHYNVTLDSHTKIIGAQMGKIPKFFLKNGWQPMSTIFLSPSNQFGKTGVFTNNCDLIITWSDAEPVLTKKLKWQ